MFSGPTAGQIGAMERLTGDESTDADFSKLVAQQVKQPAALV